MTFDEGQCAGGEGVGAAPLDASGLLTSAPLGVDNPGRDWLAGEEDLVAVRGLQTDLRRLALTPQRRQLMGAVTVGGVPLTALAVGIGLWYRRRRR